jgi:hypothetical protein
MLRALCSVCGREHDFASLEPSYRWPDAYLAVPPAEREHRTFGGKDDCGVRDADDSERRYFLRAGMHMPIHGEVETCCWGIWVEVPLGVWNRIRELWSEPSQADEPPFESLFANSLIGYENTLGLPGTLHLTGPTSIPAFRFRADVKHPVAVEQRAGVAYARRLEWLSWSQHAQQFRA